MRSFIKVLLSVLFFLSPLSTLLAQDTIVKDFTATGEGRTVLLEWTTDREVDLVEFRIQRSFDGQEFFLIDQLSPRGDNSQYTYIDNDLFKNNNHIVYYRIEVLLSGKRTQYSPVSQATISYSDIHRTWGSIKAMFK